jgi:hypothetical protein
MEKMNSKKVGKVIGAVLAVFLLAMVMQPSIVSAQSDQGAIRVCYDYLYPWHLQKHEYRVVVGYEDTALFCIDEEIRREYPGNTGDGSDCTIFTIKAPMEPGMYSIYKTYTKGLTCSEAKEHYESNPDARDLIDHFEVKADIPDKPDEDENEEWKRIYIEDYTVDFVNSDEHGRYSIVFYQHYLYQNELRLEIDTWERNSVGAGSVSMSVTEDVWINYHSGKAWGIYLGEGETDFKEIELNPLEHVGIQFFKLILGCVPYVGLAINMVECDEALRESKEEFSIFDEVDRTGHFTYPSKVFNTTNYLNDRDVVIIAYPCGIIDGKSVVRVDLPLLEFPYEGTHDIVFCIDGVIIGNVRHYVALPIEIGKQRMEA